jgi:hypothetical protein
MENEYPGLMAGKVAVHCKTHTAKEIALLTLEIKVHYCMQNF